MGEFDDHGSADRFEHTEDPVVRAWVDQQVRESLAKQRFAHRLGYGAEMHWFFYDGELAFHAERFMPSVLCYLHGIESTARWLHRGLYPKDKPDLVGVSNFNHTLLCELRVKGLGVESLAFPGETDFMSKIEVSQTKKNSPRVEVLRHRNNIAHGNLAEYFQKVPDTDDRIFAPECLRDLAHTLRDVADAWTKEILRWRTEQPLVGPSMPPSPAP